MLQTRLFHRGCRMEPWKKAAVRRKRALELVGYETVQVDWKPVAGGDKQMQELLAILGGF